jgi:putative component of membrane protein insertase Oxa1/YidC/SpoIIIJ protein YidD
MKWVGIIFISLSFVLNTSAQNLSKDIEQLSGLNKIEKKDKKRYGIAENNKTEMQMMLSALFLFYKKNISSQDGNRCAFNTSCSEYALIAIKKQGIIIGTINFFDRFTRCNTCSPHQYRINSKTHRFEDQVF